MLHFICGRAGTGKTTRICELAAESLASGRRVFLLVPEQQAVDAEARMTELIGGRPALTLEILNFKRLCNRIFREYGGLSYNYITKSGRALLMWKALSELSGQLNEYSSGSKNDVSLVSNLLGAVNEFKTYRITPSALERSMKLLSEDESDPQSQARAKKLADKLSDLSLIYADYLALVSLGLDDAADDLTKAAELLREEKFFADSDVFLDSFNGFTPQEFEIVRLIMRQADSTTISLCVDEGEPFVNQNDTFHRLQRLAAAENRHFTLERLTENHRSAAPELRFIEKNLWSLDLGKSECFGKPDPEALVFVECPNLFSECEAAAIDILRRVRGGEAWRDFAITMRGCERYDGIIDVILEKYGIPFFFSKRTDITSKPLIRLILAAMSIKSGGFRTSDVISYLKTGLAGIDADAACALECYAETWSIRGQARWESEWEMDPRGYMQSSDGAMSEASAKLLCEINSTREQLILPLIDFFAKLDACQTVTNYSRALYDFLMALDIPEQLEKQCAALRAEATSASLAEADELRQLWGILVDALDELCSTLPDQPVDGETYVKLLNLVFADTDIGRIPATIDEVVVGDASLLRASRRHMYVIGANEGIFPQAPDSGGIFSDSDRQLLASMGLELAGDCEYRSADERYTFYRALTSASHSLTVIWSNSDLSGKTLRPSLGTTRLLGLFDKPEIIKFADLPLSDRLEGRGNLLEFCAEAARTPLGDALREYCSSDEALTSKLNMLSVPLSESDVTLEAGTSKLIAGGDLALTQSRLDSYVLCHFSYFCKYILKLEDSAPARFDAGNIGTFVHHVLELFVSQAEREGKLVQISDVEIERLVDEIIAAYMTDICRIAPDFKGSRLGHLFAKLRRSSRLLCRSIADEFAQSEFLPAFYELPIGYSEPDTASVAPLEVRLDDGHSAYIYGIADRVDTLKRGDKLYVRVIDYKTGSKEFSMDDIALGLNLQMLLYLFSLWKNGGRSGSALHDLSDNAEILPAGVLYFSANVPTVTLDNELPPEEVAKRVSEKLTRRGLLLDDKDVLTAMEHELGGHFLPVKIKKDGSFYKTDALKSLADFGGLLNDIEATIRKIGGELKRGSASAHPLRRGDHNPCQYCEMKPICRHFDR